jgi:hypothetical protein
MIYDSERWNLSMKGYLMGPFVPFCLELPYFFLQVHFSDGLLQPTHTPFLIAMPQVLHGSHPQVWHIETSLIPDSSEGKHATSLCKSR